MPNDDLPVVSIIVVNYNGKRFLDSCFNSLLAVDYPQELIEIIMVDNGSDDGSIQHMKETLPSVKVLVNDKNNYARANNLGIRHSHGKYLVFINNDIVVERNWLKELVRCAEADPLIGAVGSKILFKDGKVQSLGLTQYPNFYWGDIGFYSEDMDNSDTAKELTAISGCSALYRRSCLDAIGGFDEDFNIYLEDVDLGIRCRKNGWKLFICPESIIHHEFHGTIGSEENARKWQEANRLLLVAKHWPDKLVEALQYNKGYFCSMPGALRVERDKELAQALQRVDAKLTNEYGKEKAKTIKKDIKLLHQNTLINKGIPDSQEFSPLFKEIMRRDELITQLTLALESKDTAKIASDKEIMRRDERILQLCHDLEFNKIASDKDIMRRDERIIQLSRDWESKNEEVIAKNSLLENTRMRIEALEGELRGLYNSTGYRYLLKPTWDIIFSLRRLVKYLASFLDKPKELLHHSYGGYSWREAYFKHLKYETYPPYPQSAVLMLTKRCNLHCVFCDIANVNEEMTFEDAKKVIDNVSKLRITSLVITGGEPFLHPQLFDIVKYAKDKGLKIYITTNGSLIDEYFDKIVDSQVDILSVSLDGLSQIHDALRNKPGLSEKVKNAVLKVKKLESRGQNVSISFVITNKNIQELELVYDWAAKERIFMDFWPVNFHSELHINTDGEYATLRKFIKLLKDKGELPVEKYNYLLGMSSYCNPKKSLRVRCLALTQQLGIDVDGNIRLCCVWDYKHEYLGNAIRDNLEELWHSAKYREARRSLYHHGCSAGCYNNALKQFTAITGENFILSDK